MILLLAVLLVVLVPLAAPWNAVAIVAGCLLEIVEILVLRRWSGRIGRRLRPTTGAEAMVGRTGTVVAACRPDGQVRIRGELWAARCSDGADEGETVRVESVDELELVVSPAASRRRTPA